MWLDQDDRAGREAAGQFSSTPTTSNSTFTLSLTITPPPSRATFQVRPKSLREMEVVAENEARVSPLGPVAAPPNSADRVTGLVTPLMVRSPLTVKSSSSPVMEVVTKVHSGFLSASQKSADTRCSSRCLLPVRSEERRVGKEQRHKCSVSLYMI